VSVSSAAASAGNPDRAAPGGGPAVTGTARVKRGMADMLKGGVIMDVVTPEQAKIAEDAGAVAVMALERVPADIRAQGGVARMSDPDMIEAIIGAVSIPVMAKCTPRPTRLTTSTRGASPCPSSAAPPAWAKRCAGSPRARP